MGFTIGPATSPPVETGTRPSVKKQADGPRFQILRPHDGDLKPGNVKLSANGTKVRSILFRGVARFVEIVFGFILQQKV
jgi:hypothetical protein